MFEYCFGWWSFEKVPSQTKLLFAPGTGWNYSNFGLELFALAMRNLTGQPLGHYAYARLHGPIGLPRDVPPHAPPKDLGCASGIGTFTTRGDAIALKS